MTGREARATRDISEALGQAVRGGNGLLPT
jgi:hypothetical protein